MSSSPSWGPGVVPQEEASGPIPRLPQFGTPDPGDAGLCEEDEELRRWQGWTVVATPEGRLFFHNESRQLSQWHQPPELYDILGDWVEIVDESQASRPSFWRNELLRISLWKDPRQTTNVFQAALDGNLFFMQLYAEVDGQLDVVDPKGRSALHYSCAGGSTQSALFLLQRQAEVDRRDESAATPLIFACRYGYASVVKVLLDAKAELNATCDGGNTALHEAASMGQLDCLHLLLLCGADVSHLNSDREAAVDIAAKKGHYSCLTLLRRHQHPARPLDAQWGRTGAPPLPPESPPLGRPAPAAGAAPPEAPHLAAAAVAAGPAPPSVAAAAEAVAAGASAARGNRKSGRASRAQYGRRGGSDSESEERAGTDSGGASSDDSDAAAHASSRSSRALRRRERSPVALGLISRMQWVPTWLDSARRWAFPKPVHADLGMPNQYYYNEATKRWELPEEADVHADGAYAGRGGTR